MSDAQPTTYVPPEAIAELLIERVDALQDGTLIVLPARVESAGGLYRDELMTSVKELRAAGVTAEFLQPPNQRMGLSEFHADAVFVFAVGVAQNMTWDAAKAVWSYLRSKASSQRGEQQGLVRLDVARVSREGLEIRGLTLTAPADDANAEAFLRLLVGDDNAVPETRGEDSA